MATYSGCNGLWNWKHQICWHRSMEQWWYMENMPWDVPSSKDWNYELSIKQSWPSSIHTVFINHDCWLICFPGCYPANWRLSEGQIDRVSMVHGGHTCCFSLCRTAQLTWSHYATSSNRQHETLDERTPKKIRVPSVSHNSNKYSYHYNQYCYYCYYRCCWCYYYSILQSSLFLLLPLVLLQQSISTIQNDSDDTTRRQLPTASSCASHWCFCWSARSAFLQRGSKVNTIPVAETARSMHLNNII